MTPKCTAVTFPQHSKRKSCVLSLSSKKLKFTRNEAIVRSNFEDAFFPIVPKQTKTASPPNRHRNFWKDNGINKRKFPQIWHLKGEHSRTSKCESTEPESGNPARTHERPGVKTK
jgi:hypothetical protein